MFRGKPGTFEGPPNYRAHTFVYLERRNVYAQGRRRLAGNMPTGHGLACLLKHPGAKRADQTRLFRQWNKDAGFYRLAVIPKPPSEHLYTAGAAAVHFELWLVV